jgi:hypothetical protein
MPLLGEYAVRVVQMGADGNETGRLKVTHESHGLPGYAQAAFSFGTHRDKFNVLTQGIRDESIMLMSAVKTHMLSQEAGAYAESDPLRHRNPSLFPIRRLTALK